METDTLFLVLGACFGLSVGCMLRGLLVCHLATTAQNRAWVHSRGLKQRLSRPPQQYRRHGLIKALIGLGLCLGLIITLAINKGDLGTSTTELWLAIGIWFVLALLTALVPRAFGFPLVLSLSALALIINISAPPPHSTNRNRQEAFLIHPAYRLLTGKIWYYQTPDQANNPWPNLARSIVAILPGNQKL
jgi:hypothetical protein